MRTWTPTPTPTRIDELVVAKLRKLGIVPSGLCTDAEFLRRVYLDGRKPSPEVLADPTYAGYSTGRWEGDTLVVLE